MSKKTIFISLLIVAVIAVGIFYYFLFFRTTPPTLTAEPGPSAPGTTFNPINRPGVPPQTSPSPSISVAPDNSATFIGNISTLRRLSEMPVGGFMASTTASSTLVRYIDRGVGHVYEAFSDIALIKKISNTTLPRIYESYWNRDLTVAILRYIREESGVITNFYAEVRPVKISTTTSPLTTPYEVKGKFLSPAIKEIAVSPKNDKIFTLNIESDRGVGYISGFDESRKTKILDTPLTQLLAEWSEDNTVTLTTKSSGLSAGYVYFLDIKKAALKKIFGGIVGLNTKTSHDLKKILYSSGGQNKIATSLYNTSDNSIQEVIFRTLADKCVWSKLHFNEIYCAVPVEIPDGLYPDDWYKGVVSFTDQIWHLDALTGEVHLLANLLNLSNSLIDATNLTLDPKENFLYFVNKRDLKLWSLDLNK